MKHPTPWRIETWTTALPGVWDAVITDADGGTVCGFSPGKQGMAALRRMVRAVNAQAKHTPRRRGKGSKR